MTLTDLMDQLHKDVSANLIFDLNGQLVQGAFHVTEVKLANIRSIDCGSGRSEWTECVVQLLETRSAGAPMTAGKFASILLKAEGDVPPDVSLVFEVAPDRAALMRFTATSFQRGPRGVTVGLAAQSPQCKALERAVSGGGQMARCC